MTQAVYFYLPPHQWPDPMPSKYDLNWPHFGDGYYNWTLQTYLMFRDHGVACELVNNVDSVQGLIVAHRASLPETFKAKVGQLLVCIQADWGRHPYAQVHICQNKAQTIAEGSHLFYRLFWPGNTHFVHHWPQPDLVSRESSRTNEFRCLAYFGLDYNLAEQLRSQQWSDFLVDLGIEWRLVGDMSQWGDFSKIDVVLFVRDFTGNPYHNKPATKLYNAWLAKCLPVCTPESAFLQESGRDDLEAVYVDDFESLKTQIKRLKENPEEFDRRIRAAALKGENYTHQRIVDEWCEIFRSISDNDFPKYAKAGIRRWLFMRVRDVSVLLLMVMGKLKP